MEQALIEAHRIAGSAAALAKACGVSPAAVWKWLHVTKAVTPMYVLKVEAATGVSRHDLRPDIYPRESKAA